MVPCALVLRREEAIPEIANVVVVAFVELAFTVVSERIVDDAVESIPPERVERPETESEERVPIEVRDERVVTEGLT